MFIACCFYTKMGLLHVVALYCMLMLTYNWCIACFTLLKWIYCMFCSTKMGLMHVVALLIGAIACCCSTKIGLLHVVDLPKWVYCMLMLW